MAATTVINVPASAPAARCLLFGYSKQTTIITINPDSAPAARTTSSGTTR